MNLAKAFMTPSGLSSLRRWLSLALAGSVLALLAACGGGGGANLVDDPIGGNPPPTNPPPPPPPPPPNPPPTNPPPVTGPTVLSFTVDRGLIPIGAGTSTVVVRYVTTDTKDLKVSLGGETKPVAAGSGEVTFVRAGVADLPVSLTEAGKQLGDTIVSKASCDEAAKWDASVAEPICREVLAHTDVVVGVWDPNGRFYFVGRDGFTEVTNMTPWNDMDANLFYFFGGIRQQVTDEFCRIRVTAVSFEPSLGVNIWRQLYVDAKRGELHVLPGTEAVFDFDPRGSYDFVHDDPMMPEFTAYAKVDAGEFYTLGAAEFNLWFKPVGQDPQLVFPWDFRIGGNLKVMRASTCN